MYSFMKLVVSLSALAFSLLTYLSLAKAFINCIHENITFRPMIVPVTNPISLDWSSSHYIVNEINDRSVNKSYLAIKLAYRPKND